MKNFNLNGFFKTKSWQLCLSILFLSGHFMIAQTTGIRSSVSYTETEKTSFTVANQQVANQLTTLDKVGFATTERVQNYLITQNTAKDLTTTITVVSDNSKKDWMSEAKKIIMDKTGTRLMDANNAVVLNTPADPTYTENYELMKTSFTSGDLTKMYSLALPTAEDIQQLQRQGYSVQTNQNITQIKNAEFEYIINWNQNSAVIKIYEAGQLDLEEMVRYERGPNGLRPKTRIEKHYLKTGSGICYTKIIQTTYTNYSEQLP